MHPFMALVKILYLSCRVSLIVVLFTRRSCVGMSCGQWPCFSVEPQRQTPTSDLSSICVNLPLLCMCKECITENCHSTTVRYLLHICSQHSVVGTVAPSSLKDRFSTFRMSMNFTLRWRDGWLKDISRDGGHDMQTMDARFIAQSSPTSNRLVQ